LEDRVESGEGETRSGIMDSNGDDEGEEGTGMWEENPKENKERPRSVAHVSVALVKACNEDIAYVLGGNM
jgi:hypothetical protein